MGGPARRHICTISRRMDPLALTHAALLAAQDFGNFQDMEGKEREKTERLRFGRFFYRFPNGESGAGGPTPRVMIRVFGTRIW